MKTAFEFFRDRVAQLAQDEEGFECFWSETSLQFRRGNEVVDIMISTDALRPRVAVERLTAGPCDPLDPARTP